MKPIRTLLAEDHMIVREGIRTLLLADDQIEIIAEASNGCEAVKLTKELRPDVVVIDIAMPLLNGLEAARLILVAAPLTKVLVLSAYNDEAYVDSVIALGAAGFLVKQTSAQMLDNAIHAVMRDEMFFSPQVAAHVRRRYRRSNRFGGLTMKKGTNLTLRELDVIRLIAGGKSNKQAAAKLNITLKTVEKHRQHLMDKLDTHDTAGLTRYAIARRIIEYRAKSAIV
jgi:DNA-binding NarL/FixJ family response regulator